MRLQSTTKLLTAKYLKTKLQKNIFLRHIYYVSFCFYHILPVRLLLENFPIRQDKNKIRNIRFHDLRHTHATILLFLGVDIKTISERLGHADIQTTLNIYADVLKELDEQSAEKIDSL